MKKPVLMRMRMRMIKNGDGDLPPVTVPSVYSVPPTSRMVKEL